MPGLLLLAALAGSACGKDSAACVAQAAQLENWLTTLLTPGRELEPPWPTGDVKFDIRLDNWRSEMSRMVNPMDPTQPLAVLASGRPEPGLLEEELASCPPAAAQLERVAHVDPDHRTAAFVMLPDAIVACDCNVKFLRLKALIYTAVRPDGRRPP